MKYLETLWSFALTKGDETCIMLCFKTMLTIYCSNNLTKSLSIRYNYNCKTEVGVSYMRSCELF